MYNVFNMLIKFFLHDVHKIHLFTNCEHGIIVNNVEGS